MNSKQYLSLIYYVLVLILVLPRIESTSPDKGKVVVLGTKPCFTWNGNPCECQLNRCYYNKFAKECTDVRKECLDLPCSWSGTYVATKGNICFNSKTSSACDILETLFAINFGGGKHLSGIGVVHVPHDEVPVVDKSKILRIADLPERCANSENIPGFDLELFRRLAYFDPEAVSKTKDPCIEYSLPFTTEGMHELNIIMIVPTPEIVKRLMTITLNGLTVVNNLDVTALTSNKCKAIDMVFRVKITPKKDTPNNMKMRICTGNCSVGKVHPFHIAAISLTRLDKPIIASGRRMNIFGSVAKKLKKLVKG